ncbi:MAG: hypothetical protein ABIX01_01045 [Chitinophagaceae bacterium]
MQPFTGCATALQKIADYVRMNNWFACKTDFSNFTNKNKMPLQYISDNAGNHTAVLIPINEWELLTRKYEDLKQMELPKNNTSTKKPSDYAGSMPADIALAFNKHIEESRTQWD